DVSRSAASEPAAPVAERTLVKLTAENASAIWQQALASLGGLLADNASMAEHVALVAPDRLAATFRAKYNSCKTFCERPDQLRQLEAVMAEMTGGAVRVEFAVSGDETPSAADAPRRIVSQRQRVAEKCDHPMIRRAIELFGAHVTAVDGE